MTQNNPIEKRSYLFALRIVKAYKYLTKEANETLYWIELLHDSEYIDDLSFNSLHQEADEITSILASIVKTTKENTTKYDYAQSDFLNS